METNAKKIEILPNSITGPCSLAIFTLTEPDFNRGVLLPNSPNSISDEKPGVLVFLCIMTAECMSLFKTLSVQLLLLNSSQNSYCFLTLAPILSQFLAVCLASGFVGDLHQSPLGGFLGTYLTGF